MKNVKIIRIIESFLSGTVTDKQYGEIIRSMEEYGKQMYNLAVKETVKSCLLWIEDHPFDEIANTKLIDVIKEISK